MIPNSILLNLQTMKRKTMFGMLRRCVSSFCLKSCQMKSLEMIESFKETAQVFKTKQNEAKQNKTKQNKTRQRNIHHL
jgi:hypothetical protein